MISIDGRQVANGKPGKKTHDLRERFCKLRVKDGVEVVYKEQATQAR